MSFFENVTTQAKSRNRYYVLQDSGERNFAQAARR
jgi:hypothetical protein